MPRSFRPAALAAALSVLLAALGPATAPAADLPFSPAPPPPPAYGGGGGFRAVRVPLRPAPLRYDIYGYPLLGLPSPLAAGGCPAALQPTYDPDGNLAGYAPIPMCR